ncbi:YL1 nuclear protein-domain-containing protein [Melanogaster broomeanus]|nr:YL1 nuclear protein-domain-containing protein [Melanogaster broomeanus]
MVGEDSLISSRPKRSTAGNRMELALAELAVEEPQEGEDDVDFVNDKEEEDIFESDFASTDEEAAQEDMDEGDIAVREEQRRERQTARTRVEKATAAAHARQRVTFDPEVISSQRKQKPSQKKKRYVSLGVAVNAETGEVIEGSGTIGVKRQSRRTHTIMNTSATVNRMKDAEEKKASIPKKIKTITKLPTQDELIARALDAEEGNIVEHRDYLRLEEEKRARARVVRQSIEGPVLRWISRKETVKVEVQPSPPATTTPPADASVATAFAPPTVTAGSSAPIPPVLPAPSVLTPSHNVPAPTTSTPVAPPVPPTQPQPVSTPAPPPVDYRTEDVCKNYVVHELSQSTPAKPLWKDTMSAMFGDHVKWEELKVFTGKGRTFGCVSARPIRTCALTGLPAKYLDPRTNVPFAHVGAYETLTRILGHGFVWCEALGCYVGVRDEAGADEGEETVDAARDESGTGGEELGGRALKRRKLGVEGG